MLTVESPSRSVSARSQAGLRVGGTPRRSRTAFCAWRPEMPWMRGSFF
jgi:hypothetical protein